MNEFWKDKDRRRGAIGSLIVHLCLLLIFIFLGLTYYEPKPEEGIVINFGNSQTGMGEQADGAPQPKVEPVETETAPRQSEAPTEQAENPTQTQDVVDAPSLDEEQATEKPAEEKPKDKPDEKTEPTPEELEQQRIERERAEKAKELEERFGKVSESQEGGEGETGGPGDQGDPDGDPDSKSRTGGAGGGGGGGGNYLLGNRQALSKPKPEYECEEQGRVVVKIYVDRSGNVTRAEPGEKVPNGPATTTTSTCLYEKARSAAMRTTWQGDSDAPATQVGYIIYNFQKS